MRCECGWCWCVRSDEVLEILSSRHGEPWWGEVGWSNVEVVEPLGVASGVVAVVGAIHVVVVVRACAAFVSRQQVGVAFVCVK